MANQDQAAAAEARRQQERQQENLRRAALELAELERRSREAEIGAAFRAQRRS